MASLRPGRSASSPRCSSTPTPPGALDNREALASYFGHDPGTVDVDEALNTAVRKSTDARLPLVPLALAAAVAEANLATYDQRWRYLPKLTILWLDYLVGLGHTLSDAESEMLTEARAALDETDDGSEAEAS